MAQSCARRSALLLERRRDGGECCERANEGDGIEEEGREASGAEQKATQGRAGEGGAVDARFVLGNRSRNVVAGDDLSKRAALGRVREDSHGAFDEGDDDDLGEDK